MGPERERVDWGDRLPLLAAPRVVLRALEDRDVPGLFAIFGDPEVTRYWSSGPLGDLAAVRRLLEDIRASFRARSLFQWGVALREGRGGDAAGADALVGTCTLFRLEGTHGRAEIGFALGRRAWGQGLMNEALAALVGFCFGPLGLHRLEADVDPRNERSIRLLERHGFVREGHLRERYHLQGERQDALIFGLLDREWAARPGTGF